MARYGEFCHLCDKYGMQLIVGLLTGWMSGRLFIPAGFATAKKQSLLSFVKFT